MVIFYQDLRERMVHWPLFILVAIGGGVLYFTNTLKELFSMSVIINLLFVGVLLFVIYLYSRLKIKRPFTASIGLGDILLFVALAFSFSTITFIVVFIFALLFSLMLHLLLKRKSHFKTVALAGNMSLFFALVYLGYWFGIINSVYAI